jgi:predicted RNA binding protein with dsRBD fold (UPF0201 family)
MVEVRLEARCHPTEDRDKVAGAILALFPDATITGDDQLVGASHSIETFSEQLAKQRIRDAARRVMRRGVEGTRCRFRLNKQVATTGKVSFSNESHPLGDIDVVLVDDDLDALIDRIAPDTRAEVVA